MKIEDKDIITIKQSPEDEYDKWYVFRNSNKFKKTNLLNKAEIEIIDASHINLKVWDMFVLSMNDEENGTKTSRELEIEVEPKLRNKADFVALLDMLIHNFDIDVNTLDFDYINNRLEEILKIEEV